VDRIDDRVWRRERWINLRTSCYSPIRFLRMIEQFLWKLHCPGNIRDAPIKLAIDEVGAAPKEQTNRRSNDKVVAEIHPRDLVPVRVIEGESQ
jgi:hypothetical protein